MARTRAYQASEAGKAASRNNHKNQVLKHPEKIFARQALRAAMMAGYIVAEPCKLCGNPKSEAHHTDYLDPFHVVWLCRKHHDEQHIRERGRKDGHLAGADASLFEEKPNA